ncbi:MAG: AAA family ATPase [Prevotella sp.]|nr:AAA family ATPase [Prevotella sp.]
MAEETPIQALTRQRLLLQMEYYAEKEAFRRQTETMGMRRKVKRGDAWFPLRVGRSYYNSLNQLSVEVFRTGDFDIEHNFEFGRPVVFFKAVKGVAGAGRRPSGAEGGVFGGESGGGGPSSSEFRLKYFNFTATVSYVDGDRMVLTVGDSAPILDLQSCAESVGCQLSFDETSYRTMFEALDRVMRAKGNRLAELRDLFYSKRPAGRLSFAPMRFPWLNLAQERAVNEVLWSKDVAVVHGPPGTGKTTTLVEAINETLMRESQVLVCAQSNMAVDWISERLVDRGISVLRIGNPTRVNDKMLSFTYERRFEAHPDYPQLWSIRKAIRELRSQKKRGSEGYHQKMERLKSRATELEIRINGELFGEARVVASTLVGADNRLLSGMKFATLFIDEAAQALEAACWIPIRRASRVVLAGDHCQLPPTVKSIAALKAGLGKTLMERIVDNKPEVVTLLRVQYRMNEQIMRFSSDWFYGGRVESAPQIRHRGILDYDYPIEWRTGELQQSGAVSPEDAGQSAPSGPREGAFSESFVAESFGRINKDEAELTLQTLEDYFKKVGSQRILDEQIDVGIISPYRAQVQYLRSLVRKRAFFKPFRRLISVNTVDGFQGQERDIILISLVRSNEEGQIGFLRDLRRMNVAITRARMKLIILGDVATLTRHPFYKRLWEYVQEINGNGALGLQ